MSKSTIIWTCIVVGGLLYLAMTIARERTVNGQLGLKAIGDLGLVAFGAGLIGYFLTQ